MNIKKMNIKNKETELGEENSKSISDDWVNEWRVKEKKFRKRCLILAPFTVFISLAFLSPWRLVEKHYEGHTVVLYPGIYSLLIIDGKIVKKFLVHKDIVEELNETTNVVIRFESNRCGAYPFIEFKEKCNPVEKENENKEDENEEKAFLIHTDKNGTLTVIDLFNAKSYSVGKEETTIRSSSNTNDMKNIPEDLKVFSSDIENLYDGDYEQFEDDMENDII